MPTATAAAATTTNQSAAQQHLPCALLLWIDDQRLADTASHNQAIFNTDLQQQRYIERF
jgi:hypothetical protein